MKLALRIKLLYHCIALCPAQVLHEPLYPSPARRPHPSQEEGLLPRYLSARRYRDVEQDELSFNPANEAPTPRPIQVITIIGPCTYNELLGKVESLSVVQK